MSRCLSERVGAIGAYEAIVLAVGVQAVLVACLFAYLVVQNLRSARRAARAEKRFAALMPLVCRALCDLAAAPRLLAEARRSDHAVLLDCLLRLAMDLAGDEAEAVARLARDLGLVRKELRRLLRGRTDARAEAAKILGTLRIREAVPLLLETLAREREPRVRLAIASSLGEIGGAGAVTGLLSMLGDPAPGAVRRAQEMLSRPELGAGPALIRCVEASGDGAIRRAAVEVLGMLRDPSASELLLRLFAAPDGELRIKAAKAAAAIADPRFLEGFHALLGDARWEARSQAAKGLGLVASAASIPGLRAVLGDPQWWVRFNAAQALSRQGGAGLRALEEALQDDRAAVREVARYALEQVHALESAA